MEWDFLFFLKKFDFFTKICYYEGLNEGFLLNFSKFYVNGALEPEEDEIASTDSYYT